MAAPRSSWKGYLRVSLVSCPVRLYPASSDGGKISFNTLVPETLARVSMVPTDPATGKAVSRDQLVKGYEFEKGRYVVITDEDLETVQVDSSRVLDVAQFVDDAEIDPLYLDTPYWLAPDGKIGMESFRVIAEAMRREGKSGIGRLVLASRERAVLLTPRGRGLLVRTLRSAEEVRGEDAYFEEIGDGPLDEAAVTLARQIVAQKTGAFDPGLVEDRYQKALAGLINAKIRGDEIAPPQIPEPPPVIDLLSALKQSLDTLKPPATSRATRTREAAAPAAKPAPRTKAKSAGRRG